MRHPTNLTICSHITRCTTLLTVHWHLYVSLRVIALNGLYFFFSQGHQSEYPIGSSLYVDNNGGAENPVVFLT